MSLLRPVTAEEKLRLVLAIVCAVPLAIFAFGLIQELS